MIKDLAEPSHSARKGKISDSLSIKSNDNGEIDSSDESDDDSDSVDSMGDIETITPRRKKIQDHETAGATGGALPKYAPPGGMLPATIDTLFKDSPFEYEKLAKNPRLQLWAIRIPLNFPPSRLASLSFSSAEPIKCSLRYKSSSYALLPAAEASVASVVVDAQGRQPTGGASAADSTDVTAMSHQAEGGEEMSGGMKLLVPDVKRAGKLYMAPRRISQYLLLTPDEEQSSDPRHILPAYLADSATNSVPAISPSSKRPQPQHLFKFRNRAYGFDTPGPKAMQRQAMDVDRSHADIPPEKKRKISSKSKASPRK